MSRAVISLGSNIQPERNITEAVRRLRRHKGVTVMSASCVYESESVGGPLDAPSFLNAAVLVDTTLDPGTLRKELRAIEDELGRVRTADPNAPRTIDLDISLYDDLVADVDGSRIPAVDLATAPHVAVPVAELVPDWTVPGDGRPMTLVASSLAGGDLRLVPMRELPLDLREQLVDEGEFEAGATEVYDPEMEHLVRSILARLGENPDREGLLRTPLRVAKALDFLTSGYTTAVDEVVNGAVFTDDGEEMVLLKDIEFYSMCEHHMLPFYGKAHVAYLPNGKIIGLSKLARLVDVFARRLQVQERLTNQVADSIMDIIEPHGVAVVMEGAHLCMLMRGVQKQNSVMKTSAMRGTFKEDARTRSEFMQLIAD